MRCADRRTGPRRTRIPGHVHRPAPPVPVLHRHARRAHPHRRTRRDRPGRSRVGPATTARHPAVPRTDQPYPGPQQRRRSHRGPRRRARARVAGCVARQPGVEHRQPSGERLRFTLREGQLHSGTRALHRFGYRFPSFLLSDGPAAGHGDAVAGLRRSVLEAPATIDPALRAAAMAGDPFPNPGSHTPRPSVRPRTGSPKRTWTGSPPTGARKTRSSRSPSRPPSARHCTASTPAGTHWRA